MIKILEIVLGILFVLYGIMSLTASRRKVQAGKRESTLLGTTLVVVGVGLILSYFFQFS